VQPEVKEEGAATYCEILNHDFLAHILILQPQFMVCSNKNVDCSMPKNKQTKQVLKTDFLTILFFKPNSSY
jgi:hypothetical protein